MKKLLETLRATARDISQTDALIGWFTRSSDEIGSAFYAKIRDVFAVMLCYDRDRTFSRFSPPVTLTIAPLVWHKRKLYVGGKGWRRLGQRQDMKFLAPGEPDQSIRLANGRFEHPVPLGWMYLVYDHSDSPYSLENCKDAVVKRAVEQCVHMLEWHKDRPKRLGDRKVPLPALALAPTPRTYLKIREGKSLDAQVLKCAQSGHWPFVTSDHGRELYSMDRGHVRHDLENQQIFVQGVSDGEEYPVHRDASEIFLEKAVLDNFGKCVKVNLTPAVEDGGYVQVEQPLFRPIEPRNWTLDELKSREDWPTLTHLAALTDAYRYAGAVVFNAETVEADHDPWVDGRQFPVVTSVINRPNALCDESSCSTVDLFEVPRRICAADNLHKMMTKRPR